MTTFLDVMTHEQKNGDTQFQRSSADFTLMFGKPTVKGFRI